MATIHRDLSGDPWSILILACSREPVMHVTLDVQTDLLDLLLANFCDKQRAGAVIEVTQDWLRRFDFYSSCSYPQSTSS
jgi:hypothetical protein